MKKSIIVLIAIFTFFACNTQSKQNTENTTEPATVEPVQTTISIGGMHCEMCVASIEKGINGLEGIENVVVSLNDSNAIVNYNSRVLGVKEIEEAIEKRGYSIKK